MATKRVLTDNNHLASLGNSLEGGRLGRHFALVKPRGGEVDAGQHHRALRRVQQLKQSA
jgi:hypothetical protein